MIMGNKVLHAMSKSIRLLPIPDMDCVTQLLHKLKFKFTQWRPTNTIFICYISKTLQSPKCYPLSFISYCVITESHTDLSDRKGQHTLPFPLVRESSCATSTKSIFTECLLPWPPFKTEQDCSITIAFRQQAWPSVVNGTSPRHGCSLQYNSYPKVKINFNALTHCSDFQKSSTHLNLI